MRASPVRASATTIRRTTSRRTNRKTWKTGCWATIRTETSMSESYIKNVIEAALLAAARPVPVAELAQIFDEASRPTPKELRAVLDQLTADYEGRGVTVRE